MFTEEILYEKLHFLRSVSSMGPNKSQPQTAVKRYIYSFKYYVFRIVRQGKNNALSKQKFNEMDFPFLI